MAGTDHFILTLHGQNSTSANQDADNVFAYAQQGGTGGASELMNEWNANILAAITNILSVAWEFVSVSVINLDDPTDYDQTFVGTDGQRTGDPDSPFVAAGFIYVRTSRAFNNGAKRFGPISEADSVSGIPTSGYQTLLDTLAATLNNVILDAPTSSTWLPVIWRRPGTYESGVVSPPGLFNVIDEVSFRAITSQNTRKRGRGS